MTITAWLQTLGVTTNKHINQHHISLRQVLEVGSNQLMNVSMSNLHSSQLNLLDVSGNPKLLVDSHDIEGLR